MAARKSSEELLHRSEQAAMAVQSRQWQGFLRDLHGFRVYCGGRAKRTFPWKGALASGRFPRTHPFNSLGLGFLINPVDSTSGFLSVSWGFFRGGPRPPPEFTENREQLLFSTVLDGFPV